MFDKDNSGTIDTKELRTALSALGQNPSEEELFVMISQVRSRGLGAAGVGRIPSWLALLRQGMRVIGLVRKPGVRLGVSRQLRGELRDARGDGGGRGN